VNNQETGRDKQVRRELRFFNRHRPFHSNSRGVLVRQLDAIRVLPLPFVFLGKNLFEPSRLSLRRFPVRNCGVMKDDELLAATVTPKRTHLLEGGCSLPHLTLFERHCLHPFHRLIFYLDVHIAFSLLGPPVRDGKSLGQ